MDAALAAAVVLEDCPLFNAGRGSVYTAAGEHEMDAAVMCGRSRRAGAVAGVKTVRNPSLLARAVMDDGRYVMLAGSGAEAFADTAALERVDNAWFGTAERLHQLEEAKKTDGQFLDHDLPVQNKFGTIGVVALDKSGDLAACTSTGGLTNKQFGRIGDSPVIGSGTYADNRTCAVSCTGFGEEFIRAVVAHDVACRMQYLGESLERAAAVVVHQKLPPMEGSGGLIAIDRAGNVTLPFNTEGMYRAWQSSSSGAGVSIFTDA
jgi:beta-aspartyl-peptidase (threonine type)